MESWVWPQGASEYQIAGGWLLSQMGLVPSLTSKIHVLSALRTVQRRGLKMHMSQAVEPPQLICDYCNVSSQSGVSEASAIAGLVGMDVAET